LEARHKPKGESRHFSKKDKIYSKPYQAKSRPIESDKSPNKPNSGKRPSTLDSNSDRVCYSCGKSGHISRFCPQRRSDSRSKRVDTVSSCQLVHDDNRFCCQHESGNNGTLKLECGCALPFVACLTVRPDVSSANGRLPVTTGRVNDVDVSVLRDTGCTTVVVRRDLVHDEQLTGEFRYYRMIDGTVKRAAMAVVDIETPIYQGKCLVCVSILRHVI